ncbi:hypothetical protein [Pseudomonas oryzihabitans]|uniref:Methyl-accepting chemotaxis protein n=1 Tax=Pseudomonas oryzihabitans TaxID=47885 RepID=A0AAJ2EVF1_9PSED|nr:hypothetical protein [Pseudomonas psychrotolerans]MDR6233519.1 methyl-accepting chemotaxis protein [Pseudomonas psychrotolerans]MDR6357441.1 methyl-accepting chemotaxis protein [Pseudomonas psychrotolerans]
MLFARSLRSQSLLLFGGSLLLMLLIALAGFALLSRELHRYQALIEGPLERLVEIDDTQLIFKIQVQEWKNFLLRGGDPETATRYWQAFLAREAEVNQRLQKLAATLGPDLELRVTALRAQHARLGERYRAGHAAYLAHDRNPQAGDAEVRGIDRDTADAFAALVYELHERTQVEIATIRAEAQRDILLGGLALLLCGVGLLFLGVRLVERRLVDPLVACARQLDLLARGRFGERLATGRDDELGRLTHSTNLLRDAAVQHTHDLRNQAAEIGALSALLASQLLTEPGQPPRPIEPQTLKDISRRLTDVARDLQDAASQRQD